MRIGVIGCGYWGAKHFRVLTSLSDVDEVVAIDASEGRRNAIMASFPGSVAFPDLAAALPYVDAVVVATPPTTHADLALMAISEGKHVLVEKPLATSSRDARRLVRNAASKGVTLAVGHTFEYNAAVWALRQLVQDRELGKIHYIDTARLSLGLYQRDVNVVWDLAPHDISISNFVLGSKPTSVQTWASKHVHRSLEDVAHLRLHYEDIGVTTTAHVSWLYPQKIRRVTVVGSRKMAVYNDVATEERIRVHDVGVVGPDDYQNASDFPLSYRYGDITSPYISFEEPLAVQNREFLECINTGRTPAADGHNGLAVVEVLEAAAISNREGRTVRIDEVASPAVAAGAAQELTTFSVA